MVISLSILNSGTGDYLDALRQFLNYTMSKDAKFVTTIELVNMSRIEVYEAIVERDDTTQEIGISSNATINATIKPASSSGCATCDSKRNQSVSIVTIIDKNASE